eukprot:CAMPEP_0197826370 /NCGR_PEP_ID=MMETSP1437-20131217/3338_1 /TAXON_ID=49252 ORGANISM="Eucampia antarctica, Strain CCMP1452" /NCGR_SAMPLE_ID=MMETSP1437 /ASSEMBLY_ACC=CAM_ASM_001096 /LENGTH=392 /DNA_ID=CAMNT_0043426781 /DNA_START=88 /DNA_END=1267 /DNA_ORIENTATION=+
MAHNPLLGSRISLISKKNIRYEGTLYSINELDATVALQNVRAFGTEGREKIDPTCTFVSPQDAVHPYLLFRGCDIKDLHVHESASTPEIPTTDTPPPTDPAILSTSAPPEVTKQRGSGKNADPINKEREDAKKSNKDDNITNPEKTIPSSSKNAVKPPSQPPRIKSRDPSTNKKGRKIKSTQKMIGTGASLLNRKARGAVEGVEGPDQTHVGDFDFESNLAEFSKVNIIAGENDTDEDEEDDSNDEQDNIAGSGTCVYTKDDFFDEISCDVLDKQNGIDNRLRGAAERSLNTETFGAVSLGTEGEADEEIEGDEAEEEAEGEEEEVEEEETLEGEVVVMTDQHREKTIAGNEFRGITEEEAMVTYQQGEPMVMEGLVEQHNNSLLKQVENVK